MHVSKARCEGWLGRGGQWGGHLGCRADRNGGHKGSWDNRGHCGGIEGALWGPCGAETAGWGGLGEEAAGAGQWGMEKGLGQSLGMGLWGRWDRAGECGRRPVAN